MDEHLRRLIGDIPDSRPRERRGEFRTPAGIDASPVYCANCGKPSGYAYVSTDFILYLCDECEKVGGGLPLPVVDEDYVRGRKEQD